jgi:hypothetical protein
VDTSAPQTFRITVNAPPTVSILVPTNGTVFIAPADVTIVAHATDPDGRVEQVDFFEGTNYLGDSVFVPFQTVWSRVPAGQYQLRARAIDNHGASAESAPVSITVLDLPPMMVVSPVRFNPQSGLFEVTVRISNPTTTTFPAVRVLVYGLASNAQVYNASGTNNGVPFVQSRAEVPPGESTDLVIEFYAPDRVAPEPTLVPQVVLPITPPNPVGNFQRITRQVRLADATFLIEWDSVAGRTYYVQYSHDLARWMSVTPGLTGSGTKMQWIDNGPPKTDSRPSETPYRFFRVLYVP